jgi:hypothetical protein
MFACVFTPSLASANPVMLNPASLLVHFRVMTWKRMLAYITGSADQELLLRNEYLATENRLLKNQIKGRVRLTDAERISLAEIGKRLGRKALG